MLMKITIKTTMIELSVEDERSKQDSRDYFSLTRTGLIDTVKDTITEAIRLHNEVVKGYNQN